MSVSIGRIGIHYIYDQWKNASLFSFKFTQDASRAQANPKDTQQCKRRQGTTRPHCRHRQAY
jgi:hypothetical protein